MESLCTISKQKNLHILLWNLTKIGSYLGHGKGRPNFKRDIEFWGLTNNLDVDKDEDKENKRF